MSSCSQLDDYVAGRLGNADTAAFEAHAATCESCGRAVARKKAVERAAKVLKRNEVSRGPGLTPSSNAYFEESAKAPEAVVSRPSAIPTPDYGRPTDAFGRQNRGRLLIVGGIGLALLVGGFVVFNAKDEAPDDEEAVIAAEPTKHDADPEPPPIEAPPPAPSPSVPTKVPDEPALEPAPPPVAAPAPTPAPTPPAKATPVDPKLEFYPVGTDYELLAETIAGKKCGMAVSALRARVVTNPSEARTWSLLTQCYVKRKRWKNAIDAYDMVVKHGDAAMVDSLAGPIEKARAGLQAETDAAAAEAPPPAPVE